MTAAAFDHTTLDIQPRNEDFAIDASLPREWLDGDPVRTYWFNAMSTVFPEGERTFIHSVRAYKDEIKDPKLLEQVRGFIAQEAIHGREHETYNEVLEEQGLDAARLERVTKIINAYMRKNAPKSSLLAGTCAAEHFTAVLAHVVLSNPAIFENAHPTYRAIWAWHSIEETEHKAVAFDVYKTVMPNTLGTYLRRVGLFALGMPGMQARFTYNWAVMMRKSGHGIGLKNWGRLAKFLFGRQGLYTKALPLMLDYFRPNFHPWDHDNRALLAKSITAYGDGAAAHAAFDSEDLAAIPAE